MINTSFSVIDDSHLKLGHNIKYDSSSIIGCIPERHIKSMLLSIREGAVIRSGAVIYSGTSIGENLNVGHNAIIREENIIGDNFSIWSNSTVDYGCTIGDNVKVHHNVYVAQFTVLEDGVFLAPGVIIANDPHPGCSHSRECMRGPTIKKGAQIGANATILPFVTIGERALVGSGSVVTKDVPPGAVVYGNPARVAGKIGDLTCVVNPPLTTHPYN